MCRMLIAAGEFDTAVLLDSFLQMATGRNERHERNRDRVLDHPDGWGIAYLESGTIRKYKKEIPVWEDKTFDTYRNVDSPAILLHARRSASTRRSYENTQPFYRKMHETEYVFCHNGSVNQSLEYDPEFYPLGETDSEMFFYYVLTSLTVRGEDSLAESLAAIERYSAANMIMMNGEIAHLAVQYSQEPLYYTMKLYCDGQCLIISSERLPSFQNAVWQPLNNMSLVTFNLQTLEYEVEEYRNDQA